MLNRHYYSFIRDRNGDELGRWMMFNDSSVSFFNPDHIEREAFGGEETFRYAGYGASRVGAFTQTRYGVHLCHVHPTSDWGAVRMRHVLLSPLSPHSRACCCTRAAPVFGTCRSIMRNALLLFYDRVTPKATLLREPAAGESLAGH